MSSAYSSSRPAVPPAETAPAQAQARARFQDPSLVVNALSNWGALGVVMITGFLLTPFVIAHVGKAGYGIWTLVGSIIGYYGILDLGIGAAVGRYVAYYHGQGDRQSLNETLGTSLGLFTGMGLVVLVLGLALVGPLTGFFQLEGERAADFRVLAILMTVSLAMHFPGKVFRSALRAHERLLASNLITIAVTLGRVGLIVWLLRAGWGLTGVAAATLATDAAGVAMHVGLCRLRLTGLSFHPRLFRRRMVVRLMTFGGISMFIVMADTIRFSIDAAVIGRFHGMEPVAVYAIAAMLVKYFYRIIESGNNALWPRLCRLEGAGERGQLQAILLKTMWFWAALGTLIAGGMIVAGRPFIHWWVGPDFDEAYLLLAILAVAACSDLVQAPAVSVLYALNRRRVFVALLVIEALANLVLSLILVQRMGILGVALGTAIPMFTLKMLVFPIHMARMTGVSLWAYYARVLACVGAVAGIGLLTWWYRGFPLS